MKKKRNPFFNELVFLILTKSAFISFFKLIENAFSKNIIRFSIFFFLYVTLHHHVLSSTVTFLLRGFSFLLITNVLKRLNEGDIKSWYFTWVLHFSTRISFLQSVWNKFSYVNMQFRVEFWNFVRYFLAHSSNDKQQKLCFFDW